MPPTPRPLIARLVPKITAPPRTPLDPWHEAYPLLAAFPFDRHACWIWTGAYSHKRGGKRPVIQSGKRGSPVALVFRIMLALKDQVPLSRRRDYHACHEPRCANPQCINPFHGYWGTPGRNHEDREQYAPETFKRKESRS